MLLPSPEYKAWYNNITVHSLTNPRNKDTRSLPMGYQPNTTTKDIMTESNRMILAEFEKPATRNVSQYKSLIAWATKALKDAFDAARNVVSCRTRAANIAEDVIEQPLTQPRQPLEGRAQRGRPGTRRNRQDT